MTPREVLAPAKINLFLEVHPARPGERLHRVDTLIEKVTLFDRLLLETGGTGITLECRPPLGPPEENLAWRAADLLRRHCRVRRGARITLEKRIPAGAGLGGGSSDAAAVMLALDRMWGLGLPRPEMVKLALSLGSDIPVFLCPGRCRVSGTGEIVEPLPGGENLSYRLYLTGIPVSTAEAYRALDRLTYPPLSSKIMVKALTQGDRTLIGKALFNRFESALPALESRLPGFRLALGRAERYPLLSGSGGSFFALEAGDEPLAGGNRPGRAPCPGIGVSTFRGNEDGNH